MANDEALHSPQPAKSDAGEKLEFEACLAFLEKAADALDSGELTLEQALCRYEEAISVIRRASALLEGAELRIQKLAGVDSQGKPQWTSHGVETNSGSSQDAGAG